MSTAPTIVRQLPFAVAVKRSPMGGGWVWGITQDGWLTLQEYYGTAAGLVKPLGRHAYLVQPSEAEDLADYLMKEGIAWEVQP